MHIHPKILVKLVSIIHTVFLTANCISIPCLIILEPFYIWMPMITMLGSPLIGGSYCLFNQLENYYRQKANMPVIKDRSIEIIKFIYRNK